MNTNQKNHVLLSVNPKAGRSSSKLRAERLAAALEKEQLSVELLTDLDLVAQKANALFHEGKLRALVGVGGDGTAAELTNRTEPGVPIALLPAGTANLLAKHLRYPFSPEKFARKIVAGKTATMDVARCNGRILLAMVGCGFDAEVVAQVHAARMTNPKGAHIGYHSYLGPIWRSIRNYTYPPLQVEFLNDDGSVRETVSGVHWAFFSNIPKYGWGLPITPKAQFDDGQFDACLWRGGSLLSGLFLVCAAQLGIHGCFSRCTMKTGTRFRVVSLDPTVPVPFQLDGDPGENLPVEIEVLPNRLTVVV
ncbi:MAG: diacylglycerol kinase family protein [Planctomycetia bacterium]|nr:diacylglycerol kinase family protein [Planctomycetia bacterium]